MQEPKLLPKLEDVKHKDVAQTAQHPIKPGATRVAPYQTNTVPKQVPSALIQILLTTSSEVLLPRLSPLLEL